MLIFRSKHRSHHHNPSPYSPSRSITPPPEKAFELPKEWATFASEEKEGAKSNPKVRSRFGREVVDREANLQTAHRGRDEEEVECEWPKITRSEPEFTTVRDLKVWLGTWNVNGKKIDENINIWLTGSVTGKPIVVVFREGET